MVGTIRENLIIHISIVIVIVILTVIQGPMIGLIDLFEQII